MNEHGIWTLDEALEHHIYSSVLAKELAYFFAYNLPIIDVGCGRGDYCKYLTECGFDIIGYDGTKDIDILGVYSPIEIIDLGVPTNLKSGQVLCLEVGEHLPAECQNIVLDNLVFATQERMLLSWATPGQGGYGHLNEQTNEEIIMQIEKRGLHFDQRSTNRLRRVPYHDAPYFNWTLMAFNKPLPHNTRSLSRVIDSVATSHVPMQEPTAQAKIIKYPPVNLIRWTGSDSNESYVNIGKSCMDYIRPYVKNNDRVLDIGCACGRIAQALFEEFDVEYEGFDVSPPAIEWCNQELKTDKHHFQLAPIKFAYNPTGTIAAQEYKFPWPDDYFDFVWLTSIFTHLQTDIVINYANEINRVLRPGKAAYITFFFYDVPARKWANWHHKLDDVSFTATPDNPEAAIAYKLDFIKTLFNVEQVQFGEMVGQDLIIHRKK